MDLKTPGAAGSKASVMVLQDPVSGEAQAVALQQAVLSPRVQFPPPVPHWLSTVGWTVLRDVACVYSLPSSGRAPPWPLVSSFPVHLRHSYVLHSSIEWVCMKSYSCSSVLNSPIEWVRVKILGIPPSLCLPRLSRFVILTNTAYISKLLSKFGW